MSDKNRVDQEEEDDFSAADVAEVVDDDASIAIDQNGDEETMEIDLRNNSTTYFDKHADSVYFIAAHPKIPLVVSGGGDNIAYLWSTEQETPSALSVINDHTESVNAGGFTSNGEYLVTGDMSGRTIVWKLGPKGELSELVSNTAELEEVISIVMHPTQNVFAVSDVSGQIWVNEIADGAVSNIAVLTAHTMSPTAMVFLPPAAGDKNETMELVSVGEDNLIVKWNVYTGQPVFRADSSKIRGEHAWVSLALSPSNKSAVVGSMDGTMVIIKLEDGTLLNTVDTTVVKPFRTIEDSRPRGKSDANAEDDEEEEMGYSVEGLAWSSMNLVATGNVEGVVIIWDIKTWKPRSTFQLEDAVTQLEFVPGTRLLTVSSMDGIVVQYDVISSERVWEMLGHSEGVLSFASLNGGKRVITAGDDHVCLVFDKPVQDKP